MSSGAARTVRAPAGLASEPVDLAAWTGAGVKVGIVDSGYTPGRAPVRIGGGVQLAGDGAVSGSGDAAGEAGPQAWPDRIGHGTACAGIIARKAPGAVLYPIRIFDRDLVSDTGTMIQAIEWASGQGLDVLNLSLGTTELAARQEMEDACRAAGAQGMMVVAATANDGRPSVPACLPGVFGVAAGRIKGKYEFYFDAGAEVQFVARGDRQRLDWIDGRQVFLGGTSFAAPHATAIVALVLEAWPGICYEDLCNLLQELSVPDRPALVTAAETVAGPVPARRAGVGQGRLSDLHGQQRLDWLGRAVAYPFNKEMHSLVRGRALLRFELAGVVDVVGGRTIGRDSGQVIGAAPTGLEVTKNLERALESVDSVVLGYLDQISRIKRRDHLEEVLELALCMGKHVYSLSPVDEASYPGMAQRFNDRGLHLAFPTVTSADFERITGHFDWRYESRRPVVGVFGTGPSQGKFTAQLALRAELQKIGYQVGQIGTEHQSALFGFDFTFPNGYDGHRSVQIPLDLHVPLLQAVMAGIEQEDPHLTIVGTQSGVIPYSFAEKTPGYTLTTIAVLFGTLPDAYVLAVNSIDEVAFIRQTMAVLEAMGKGETIALVFSDKKKEEGTRLGRSFVTSTQMTETEIAATAQRLEGEFGIPATEVVSQAGRRKLAMAVEDFFDAEGERAPSGTAMQDSPRGRRQAPRCRP